MQQASDTASALRSPAIVEAAGRIYDDSPNILNTTQQGLDFWDPLLEKLELFDRMMSALAEVRVILLIFYPSAESHVP